MAIDRGKGVTPSEQYLADIADKTFLKLWTYPNTFMNRKISSVGSGKEICDLLVVCGDDVIIFSDKSIEWPSHPEPVIGWSRWYKRAILSSVKQITGAERWLTEYPDRIFLDQACTKRLPIELPPLHRRRVHGIAIASGAYSACQEYCNDDDGSLMIMSPIKGDTHFSLESKDLFCIGDVNLEGNFVHVFDQTALDLVMEEMSTITDFISYLRKRSEAIRTEGITWASGEADMLGSYMQTQDVDTGSYTFPTSAHIGAEPGISVSIAQHEYKSFVETEAYKAKKTADADSYNWDKLINIFLEHIMMESTVPVEGYGEPMGTRTEPGLRLMACEDRFSRRVLARSFVEFLNRSRDGKHSRFTRIIKSIDNGFTNSPVLYVFMLLAYPEDIVLEGGYEQYRQARVSMLETYCYAALQENKEIHYAVGIAMDAEAKDGLPHRGSSEDFVALHVDQWTPELESEVKERRKIHDVLNSSKIEKSQVSEYEYPTSDQSLYASTHQRRAAQRKARKRGF